MDKSTGKIPRDDAKERAAALLYFTQVHLLGRDTSTYFYQHAMKEAGFADATSKDPTTQRRIRRHVTKLVQQEEKGEGEMKLPKKTTTKPSVDTTAPSVVVIDGDNDAAASPLTLSTVSTTSSKSFIGNCRRTSKQANAVRQLVHAENDEKRRLHKLSTLFVAEQKALMAAKTIPKQGTDKLLTVLA